MLKQHILKILTILTFIIIILHTYKYVILLTNHKYKNKLFFIRKNIHWKTFIKIIFFIFFLFILLTLKINLIFNIDSINQIYFFSPFFTKINKEKLRKIFNKLHDFLHCAMLMHLPFAFIVYSPIAFEKVLGLYIYYSPFLILWLIKKIYFYYKKNYFNKK